MIKGIFILNGSAGVGKDTFVRMVDKHIPAKHYSSVTKVKGIAERCGWDGTKDEKSRKFLSDLKVLVSEYNDMVFEDLRAVVDNFINFHPATFLFIDIREPADIKRAVEEFGAGTILITNDNVKQVTSNMADAGVYDYKYDFVINNSDTLECLEAVTGQWVYAALSSKFVKVYKQRTDFGDCGVIPRSLIGIPYDADVFMDDLN